MASREITGVADLAGEGGTRDADLSSIRGTSELVQNVAAACREQASGVAQINTALSQVDQVTQRNASAAEELASTAEELSAQAEALRELMGFFKVSEAPLAHVSTHGPARPQSPRFRASPIVAHPEPQSRAVARKANGHVGDTLNGDTEFRRF
jgi:methyl-accepting chemotaxis protein